MSGIHTAVSEIPHITRKATKEGEKLLKKMWSVMDAAAEKVPPSEVLSAEARRSVQGQYD